MRYNFDYGHFTFPNGVFTCLSSGNPEDRRENISITQMNNGELVVRSINKFFVFNVTNPSLYVYGHPLENIDPAYHKTKTITESYGFLNLRKREREITYVPDGIVRLNRPPVADSFKVKMPYRIELKDKQIIEG